MHIVYIVTQRNYRLVYALEDIEHEFPHISWTKSCGMNIRTISRNMPTNFEPKRLKLKLDIVEEP